jgi:hypothetical protein
MNSPEPIASAMRHARDSGRFAPWKMIERLVKPRSAE